MKKFVGYLLALIGFVGYGFFRNYHGVVIPHSSFLSISFCVVGLVGLYIIYISPKRKDLLDQEKNKNKLIRLKNNGERILITLGNSEIKENKYYEEQVRSNSSSIFQSDSIYDPNRNYKQNYIEQSAVVYYDISNGIKNKMTSQIFDFNAEILREKIQSESLYLYIDRFDKKEFIFELHEN